jgi:hypothetical protein
MVLTIWQKNGISMRTQTRLAQKLPGSSENNISHFTFVISVTKKFCFKLGQRDNMEENPLHFDVPSCKTVNVKGAQTIISKSSGHKGICYIVSSVLFDGTLKIVQPLNIKKLNFHEKISSKVIHETKPKKIKLWLQKDY